MCCGVGGVAAGVHQWQGGRDDGSDGCAIALCSVGGGVVRAWRVEASKKEMTEVMTDKEGRQRCRHEAFDNQKVKEAMGCRGAERGESCCRCRHRQDNDSEDDDDSDVHQEEDRYFKNVTAATFVC